VAPNRLKFIQRFLNISEAIQKLNLAVGDGTVGDGGGGGEADTY
jgi:hypothetical protein